MTTAEQNQQAREINDDVQRDNGMTDTRSEFEREMEASLIRTTWPFKYTNGFRDGFLCALDLLGDLPTERSKSLREQAERGT